MSLRKGVADATGPGTPIEAGPGHRTDIDGIRTLAIGLVVAFHAGIPPFEGGFIGVDVFFVVSGFLITGVLLRELDDRDSIRLGRFWARRIRRLLPASTLAIVGTVVLSLLLLSPIAWQTTADAGTWAAAYGQNLFLGVEESNYFATERNNPFVHFWSLAVEEQFYLIWPLLMLALAKFGAKSGGVRTITIGLLVVTVASFIHSVQLTNSGSPWAYYSPLSRGWEFSAGGLLALYARYVPGSVRTRTTRLMTVVGAILIAYSLLTLSGSEPFPGWRALAPVVGTGLLIAANNGPATLVGKLLALPPIQWLGRMSYGWYLWHFPFLVIGEQYSRSFGPARRLLIVLASLGAAAVSYYIIENPVRFNRTLVIRHLRNYVMAGGLLAVSLVITGLTMVAAEDRLDNPRFTELTAAATDLEGISDRGCPEGADLAELETVCVWGDPEGATTLLVIGDSHADEWLPGLDVVGLNSGIRILARIAVACPALAGGTAPISDACPDTQAGQLDLIDALQPDAVFVSQWTGSFFDFDEAGWSQAVTDFGSALSERRIGLFWVHDPPTFPFNPINCLSISDEVSCSQPRSTVAAASEYHNRLVEAALADFDVAFLDPVDTLCDETTCFLRLHGTLIYRDSNHITATTSRGFAPALAPLILEAVAVGSDW